MPLPELAFAPQIGEKVRQHVYEINLPAGAVVSESHQQVSPCASFSVLLAVINCDKFIFSEMFFDYVGQKVARVDIVVAGNPDNLNRCHIAAHIYGFQVRFLCFLIDFW